MFFVLTYLLFSYFINADCKRRKVRIRTGSIKENSGHDREKNEEAHASGGGAEGVGANKKEISTHLLT